MHTSRCLELVLLRESYSSNRISSMTQEIILRFQFAIDFISCVVRSLCSTWFIQVYPNPECLMEAVDRVMKRSEMLNSKIFKLLWAIGKENGPKNYNASESTSYKHSEMYMIECDVMISYIL